MACHVRAICDKLSIIWIENSTYSEEISVMNQKEEDNSDDGHVCSKNNTSGEDFFQLPWVRKRRRLHSILGNGHDGSIVQDGDNKDHERGEVEFPYQSNEHESKHNTDGDGNSVDCVILHPLEDGSACQNSTHDHTESWLGQDNVWGTSRCISGISNSDTNVCLLQCWGIIHTITSHSTDMLSILQSLHNLILVLCMTQENQFVVVSF